MTTVDGVTEHGDNTDRLIGGRLILPLNTKYLRGDFNFISNYCVSLFFVVPIFNTIFLSRGNFE